MQIFHGVVNVFLGGGCVKSALNVFGMGVFLFFHDHELHQMICNVE